MLNIRVRFPKRLSHRHCYLRFNHEGYQYYGPVSSDPTHIKRGVDVLWVYTPDWLVRAKLDENGNPSLLWEAVPMITFTIPGADMERVRIFERTACAINPHEIVGLVLDENGKQIAPATLCTNEGESGW